MRQRIIFLDFDGVLNSVRSATADQKIIHALLAKQNILMDQPIRSGFDPVAVKLMWRLAERTGAYFVISSAWRKAISLRDIRAIFHTEFGWPSGDDERIIGVTGVIQTPYSMRGDEIQAWIDDHTVGVKNFQYAIIDDGADFLDHQYKRFIQTDPYEGFLYKDFKKGLDLFDEKEDDVVL